MLDHRLFTGHKDKQIINKKTLRRSKSYDRVKVFAPQPQGQWSRHKRGLYCCDNIDMAVIARAIKLGGGATKQNCTEARAFSLAAASVRPTSAPQQTPLSLSLYINLRRLTTAG